MKPGKYISSYPAKITQSDMLYKKTKVKKPKLDNLKNRKYFLKQWNKD